MTFCHAGIDAMVSSKWYEGVVGLRLHYSGTRGRLALPRYEEASWTCSIAVKASRSSAWTTARWLSRRLGGPRRIPSPMSLRSSS
jgi:hypothetical protein